MDDRDWSVSNLSPIAELMWWDPAYNLAFLQYPSIGQAIESRWDAFLRGYCPRPERKRILLYLVLQRLAASNGFYKESQDVYKASWVEKCLDDILNEIDRP